MKAINTVADSPIKSTHLRTVVAPLTPTSKVTAIPKYRSRSNSLVSKSNSYDEPLSYPARDNNTLNATTSSTERRLNDNERMVSSQYLQSHVDYEKYIREKCNSRFLVPQSRWYNDTLYESRKHEIVHDDNNRYVSINNNPIIPGDNKAIQFSTDLKSTEDKVSHDHLKNVNNITNYEGENSKNDKNLNVSSAESNTVVSKQNSGENLTNDEQHKTKNTGNNMTLQHPEAISTTCTDISTSDVVRKQLVNMNKQNSHLYTKDYTISFPCTESSPSPSYQHTIQTTSKSLKFVLLGVPLYIYSCNENKSLKYFCTV